MDPPTVAVDVVVADKECDTGNMLLVVIPISKYGGLVVLLPVYVTVSHIPGALVDKTSV